jgi:hypothetical protein
VECGFLSQEQKMRSSVGGLLALCALSLGVQAACGDVLFRNTGTGFTDPHVFVGDLTSVSGKPNVAIVEDGTFGATGGPFAITSVNVGVYNALDNTAPVDLLLQFYDTATYGTPASAPIPSNPIGPQFRVPLAVFAGADESGTVLTPGVVIPDNNFAVVARLVTTATNSDDQNFNFLFKDIPLDVGSSNDLFGADLNSDGTITRDENLTWAGGGFPAGNLYLQVDGAVVPEPGVMSLLLGAAAILMSRRSKKA